jgi:hypothetical protein
LLSLKLHMSTNESKHLKDYISGEKVNAWTDNNLERLFEESFLEEE